MAHEKISLGARRVFAEFLARQHAGEELSFDSLTAEHPELSAELERLRAEWPDGRLPPGGHSDFASRVAHTLGPEALPNVTLRMDATEQARSAGAEHLKELSTAPAERRYLFLGEVARGGMGVVLHVWDTVLRRPLAMKVLNAAGPTRPATPATPGAARFLEEAQVTGQLEHPGVVPIHDLCVDSEGRVFFTMPLIEGEDLDVIFGLVARGERDWTRTRALLALIQVCEVVSYAHSRGVVHRDLKPSNVMVGKFGEIYVMDWGVAKLLDRLDVEREERDPVARQRRRRDTTSERTLEGTVIGTPSYMSPEQAEGRVHEVDERSDVYALGAMLYHLLVGRRPYAPRRGEQGITRTLELVRRGPPTPIERLDRDVPDELIAVCNKAMERRKSDRYASVGELAADLRAYVEGRVVETYERGPWAEIKKVILRNRALSAAIAGLVLLALVSMSAVTFVHTRVNQRLEAANVRLESARTEAVRHAYLANLISAENSLRVGDLAEAKGRLADCDEPLRGFEWRHLSLSTDGSLAAWRAGGIDGAAPVCLAAGPEGEELLAGFTDGRIHVFRLDGGERVGDLEGHEEAVVALAVSPSGGQAASATAGGDLQVWDLSARRVQTILGERSDTYSCLAWAPDPEGRGGRGGPPSLITGSREGIVRRWDLDGAERALAEHASAVTSLAIAPDGARLVVGLADGTARVLRAAGGEEQSVLEGHGSAVTAAAFSQEARHVACGTEGGVIRLWDLESGLLLDAFSEHSGAVVGLAFTPKGQLVSASQDRTLRVLDPAVGDEPIVLRGHEEGVSALHLLEAGSLIASASWDGSVRLWDPRGPTSVTRFTGFGTAFRCGAFSADGSRIVLGSMDGFVLLYDAERDRLMQFVRVREPITDVAFVEGGTLLAVATFGGTVRLLDPDVSGREATQLAAHEDAVSALAAPREGGRRWVSASADGTLAVWDGGERPVARLEGHEGPVLCADVTADGRLVASGSVDGTVRLWSLEDGEAHARIDASGRAVRAVAFRPDGRALAFGDDAGRIAVCEVPGGRRSYELAEREGPIATLDWSPDGERLVSGSTDGIVAIFDSELGERLLLDRAHASEILEVAFSPNGERLLTISAASGLRILESVARTELRAVGAGDEDEGRRARSDDGGLDEERGAQDQLERAREYRAARMRQRAWDAVHRPAADPGAYLSALEHVREAWKIASDDPRTRAVLGAALARTGEHEQALEHLRHTSAEPDAGVAAMAQAFLGLIACEAGRRSDALAAERRLRAALADVEESDLEAELRVLLAELATCLAEGSR